jgi:hypothetical protein
MLNCSALVVSLGTCSPHSPVFYLTDLKQESRSFTPPLFFGASHQATLLFFWNMDELNCFESVPAKY